MMTPDFDKNPENRFRAELFAAPATIRNFFEVPTRQSNREILHNYQTSYIVARSAAVAAAEELRTVVGL